MIGPYFTPSIVMPVASLSRSACVDLAEQARAVFAHPARGGQLEPARQVAVIGQQQQAFGVEVEPPDRDHARQVLRQVREHRRAALRVLVRGHHARRLVIAPQPRLLGPASGLPSMAMTSSLAHLARGRGHRLAVERDAAFGDQLLGIAPRAHAGPRNHLGDAFALRALSRNVFRAIVGTR